MEFNELILKVSSCCNLNCKYCYVFNQGDTSYKREPAIISENLISTILERINEHCTIHGIKKFLIIFHGGEPLMVPKHFYYSFVEKAKQIVKNVKILYGIQTNGTLLTQEWIDMLDKLDISIGISIDGPEKASQNRIFRNSNKCAYNEILRGIKLLQSNNLPVCENGFTHTGMNIHDNSFDDIASNTVMQQYYYSHSDKVLCEKCKACLIKDICGGGNLAHRYSIKNDFLNPSAYCQDIFALCSHIQQCLFQDLPNIFNEKNVINLSSRNTNREYEDIVCH